MRVEHSFDWKGFRFSLKLLLLCLFVGGTLYFGAQYAASYFEPTAPATLAVVQSSPPMVAVAEAATLSSTTPERVINSLTIAEAVPTEGKFIAADLVTMKLYLYQDGTTTAEYPILTKGRPGTPYETPSGFYSVLLKERNHFNNGEGVNMPYSMEFYGNYFIHGWPTYADGTPVASTYSGGCIRLSTDDAAKVYAFADQGTGVFVYDSGAATPAPTLSFSNPPPSVSAASYLVADIDTGDVYAEQEAQAQHPIASITKLMTALVANETIMFDHRISVAQSDLQGTFVVGDLLYPLLMGSDTETVDTLTQYYGTQSFINWMNGQAKALDMTSTTFADASGVSSETVSTPEDLYRLAVYVANKKSFIWKITRTPQKTIRSGGGTGYTLSNPNPFAGSPSFVGGEVDDTTTPQDAAVSVFSANISGTNRRIAVIVFDSGDYAADTQAFVNWFTQSALQGGSAACVSCAEVPHKKISL